MASVGLSTSVLPNVANGPSGIVRGTKRKAAEMDSGGNTPRQTQKSARMGTGGKAPRPKGEVIDLTTPEIIDLTTPEIIDLTAPEIIDLTLDDE